MIAIFNSSDEFASLLKPNVLYGEAAEHRVSHLRDKGQWQMHSR